jgi:uncharacterized repeat protein (TIGR01451 family)
MGNGFRLVGVVCATVAVLAFPAVAGAAEIRSEGPLRLVGASPQLNCYVNHVLDADPEFFGTTACGTFVAAGGTLYGPADVPAGGNASPRTAWTPVSQQGPDGSGTGTDPYRITTVVTGGPLEVRQVDSYVVGQESYRSDITVTNTGDERREIILYRAGDCWLQNSDYGYGRVDDRLPSCLAPGPSGGPGDRIEQFGAISAGHNYYQAHYSEIWSRIGSQRPFPDTCRCNELIDNGAGVSWERTVAPGGSVTLSGLITFSPMGNVPISLQKAPDQEEVAPGGVAGYTITLTNPNLVEVTLTELTDDHSEGFAYIPGSTSGLTDADPVVTGTRLTWGPLVLPPNSETTVHYSMRVPETPGVYRNVAGGVAEGYTVIPAEEPPPIDVPDDPEQSLEADVYVLKSMDETSGTAGGRTSYTITLNNPNARPLPIARVTEVLGEGFRYIPGSTSGLTTDDPEIDGRRLTWRVDAEVPPLSAVKLRFGVRLPDTDERVTRLNPRVSAAGPELDVLPARRTAPIRIFPRPTLGAIRLRKGASRSVVRAGRSVRFTLRLSDLAHKHPTTATICDRIPRGLRLVGGRPASRRGNRFCWVRRLPAGVRRARVSYVVRARPAARGRVSSVATATARQRDPARARGGVRVIAPQPPAVTG